MFDGGKEAIADKLEGRGHGVVGSAFQMKGGRLSAGPKGWEKRLGKEGGGAGGADGELVIARTDGAGMEDEFSGVEFCAVSCGVAELGHGADAGEVLAHESGLRALSSDVL